MGPARVRGRLLRTARSLARGRLPAMVGLFAIRPLSANNRGRRSRLDLAPGCPEYGRGGGCSCGFRQPLGDFSAQVSPAVIVALQGAQVAVAAEPLHGA